jgi:guanylate kinase
VRLHAGVAKAYLDAAMGLRRDLGLSGDLGVVDLLGLPGVLETSGADVADEETHRLAMSAVDAAAKEVRFDAPRRGGRHRSPTSARGSTSSRLLRESVAARAGEVPLAVKRKLEERLRKLGLEASVDPTRLAQEVAYLADKADIMEELARLRGPSHALPHAARLGRAGRQDARIPGAGAAPRDEHDRLEILGRRDLGPRARDEDGDRADPRAGDEPGMTERAAAAAGAGLLLVLTAPSGTGKSSVVKELLARESRAALLRVADHASAALRRKGRVDYRFVTEPEFQRHIEAGDLVEWARVHGHLYGTAVTEIDRALADGRTSFLDIDVQGAKQVSDRFPGAVSVFLLPPDYAALEARLRGRRSDTDEAIAARLRTAAGRGPPLRRVPVPGRQRRHRARRRGSPLDPRRGAGPHGAPDRRGRADLATFPARPMTARASSSASAAASGPTRRRRSCAGSRRRGRTSRWR